MRPSDRTSMGGPNERFLTTEWTVILHAQGRNEDVRRAAMDEEIRDLLEILSRNGARS